MSSKKADARERVKAMREEQLKQERKKERVLRFGIAGAVVAAVAIIAVAVAVTRGGGDDSSKWPSGVTDDGGVAIGAADAPVTIDAWVDFLCPHCADFEEANGPAIDELVESGQARVVYHPVTYTGTVYAARANNAFGCAADEGMAAEFFKSAFEAAYDGPVQWSNNDLVDLGASVGIGGEYESCVRDDVYNDWASQSDDVGREAGVDGTPTIFINGTELPGEQWTPEGIQAAVTAAAAESGSTDAPAPTTPPATTTP